MLDAHTASSSTGGVGTHERDSSLRYTNVSAVYCMVHDVQPTFERCLY